MKKNQIHDDKVYKDIQDQKRHRNESPSGALEN